MWVPNRWKLNSVLDSLQSSSLHKQLMLMATSVIILSFKKNSVGVVFALGWESDDVAPFTPKNVILLARGAWCVLRDSTKYLCLLRHTVLLPHIGCHRQLQFIAFLHNFAIPFHHQRSFSFVGRWKMTSFFTQFVRQPVYNFSFSLCMHVNERTRAYELWKSSSSSRFYSLHDDENYFSTS